MLEFFNRQHLKGRENDSNLRARIKSFETAAGMQTAAPEAFDLSKETDATHKLYGLKRGDTQGFGWQCMVARRLVERDVRFIELIDGDTRIDFNWDTHANNFGDLLRQVPGVNVTQLSNTHYSVTSRGSSDALSTSQPVSYTHLTLPTSDLV